MFSTPPPYVPPPSDPTTPDGSGTPGPAKRKRTGLLIGAAAAVIALVVGGIVAFGGGDDGDGEASTDSTLVTDDTSADTTAVGDGGGSVSDALETGLLSALDLEATAGAMTLQGEAAFPSDVLCDAEDVIDTSNFVDYRSRFFADNPDFSGKIAAAGAIEFPDSDSADAFLVQLTNFGASHVVSDECPLRPIDFFDGTVAFTETPPGGGDQGAIGFAKVEPDVVVFVGFGDPTGMDPSSVQFLVQVQKEKMDAELNGDTSDSGADDTEAGDESTLQLMQDSLLAPDDVGESFDQAITSVDPEVDYLCYSEASADRSSATEVDEQLFGPDGATRGRGRHALVPGRRFGGRLPGHDRGLPRRERPERLCPHAPTDRQPRVVDDPRRLVHLHLRRRQWPQPGDLGQAWEHRGGRDRQPTHRGLGGRPRLAPDRPVRRGGAHHGLGRVGDRDKAVRIQRR